MQKNNTKKRRWSLNRWTKVSIPVAIAAVMVMVGITMYGMLAYQTDSETAMGSFNLGYNVTVLTEEDDPATASMSVGLNTYSKSVAIQNVGYHTVPCFVRVFVEFSDSDAAAVSGYSLSTNPDGNYYSVLHSGGSGILTEDITDSARSGLSLTPGSISRTSGVSNSSVNLKFTDAYDSHLPAGWTYVATGPLAGYYYYTPILGKGETTPALFDRVATFYPNDYSIHAYKIFVYAESIQAHHLNGAPMTSGETYADIWAEYLALSSVE